MAIYWHNPDQEAFYFPECRRALSSTEKEQVFSKCGGKCFYCGKKLTIYKPNQNSNSEDKFFCDHFIPYARGGKTTIENSVAACWDCNSRKKDKHPTHYQFILHADIICHP